MTVKATTTTTTNTNTNTNTNTTTTTTTEETLLVRFAPPAWHTACLLFGILYVAITKIPSLENIDSAATIELLTSTSGVVTDSVFVLAVIRLFFGISVFFTTASLWFMPRVNQVNEYRPGSKLKSCEWVCPHSQFLCYFTSNSWNMLGWAFLLNGTVAMLVATGNEGILIENYPWILRLGLILYETAAPVTLLVAVVVTYVLWPTLLASAGEPGKTDLLKPWPVLNMHNGNVLMVLFESALLGTIPYRFGDVVFPVIYGCCYVLFQWVMSPFWQPKYGAQFLYFFFDTTLPLQANISLCILLTLLIAGGGVFWALEELIHNTFDSSTEARVISSFVVAFTVCRFRDEDIKFVVFDNVSKVMTKVQKQI